MVRNDPRIETDERVIAFPGLEDPSTVATTVIMPAHNEAAVIADVIRRVRRAVGAGAEILVVDDGSTDDTAAVAEEAGARVIRRPYCFGNGSAVKAGVRAAQGDRIVLIDADGQHDPAQIPELLAALDEYDMVVAARAPDSHASRGRRLANKVFNGLASHLTKKKIEDLTSGYRAVRRHVIEEFLPLLPNQFSYPTTITLCALKAGYTVHYVPTRAARRVKGTKSHIRPAKDGLHFLTIILKIVTLYSPLRVFAPISLLPVILGALSFVYRLFTGRGASVTGALFLSIGLFLFCMGLISEQIAALRFERGSRNGVS
ncbi:MAG: glycosyltransferase family 2 protein [Actinobacteria bacterium]|nr:glycosyltransferase family 2 protein [Actinomycetota bacterium]